MNNTFKKIIWVFGILILGFLVPFFSFHLTKSVYSEYAKKDLAAVSVFDNFERIENEKTEPILKDKPEETKNIVSERIDKLGFNVAEYGKFVEADIASMTVRLFEDGEVQKELKILSIGKGGSPWETPTGFYNVITKERNHYSSIGHVWMPWSVQFFGNFFIHGWPYYTGGIPVRQGYSGGCIRMATIDAKEIYDFVEPNTSFLVTNENEESSASNFNNESFYFLKNKSIFPQISADAFLVADVNTGLIIKEKNRNKSLPVASVSKLMTALISLEAVNQYSTATISANAVLTYGEAGLLKMGEKIEVRSLLFPLLLSSSNDAAVAIAEQMGEKNFINLMNKKARAIGLYNTRFDDSSGLDEDNVSTTEDLFRLLQYIYESKNYILQVTRQDKVDSWHNNNKFSKYEEFLGGKNGYTPEAKETSVALFSLPLSEFGERRIAIVLLGSSDRKNDVDKILKWLKSDVFYSEQGVAGDNILKMVFVGDIMMGRGVENSVTRWGDGDFNFIFEKSDFIKKADVSFGNLEGPISDKGTNLENLYSFRFKPETADALKNAGFDVLSVANNHAGDWGRDAFEDTLKRLSSADILSVGGGFNREEATSVRVIEKDNIKIGFLGFSDTGPEWLSATASSSGILLAPSTVEGLASDDEYKSTIRKASKDVDVLVVSIHFGEEYQETANSRQKLLSKRAIDSGAKIVIGHHPHIVQSVENYKDGLIAYSLGNFVFDQNFSEETMGGMVLEVILRNNEIVSVKENTTKINRFFQPVLLELAD